MAEKQTACIFEMTLLMDLDFRLIYQIKMVTAIVEYAITTYSIAIDEYFRS